MLHVFMDIKKIYTILFLDSVNKMIADIPEADRAKIAAAVTVVSEGRFNLVYIKPFRGKLRELIVKKYRFIFFIHESFLYFIHSFVKKSNKTPKKEIDRAQKTRQIIMKKINQR